MKLVTCKKCAWVSFAITNKQAEKEIDEFNTYYNSLSDKDKLMYNGPSTKDGYVCIGCNGSDFRKYRKSDGDMTGHTINPVICELEKA